VPARYLDSAGQRLRVEFVGTFNNLTGSKNLKVYYNGTQIFDCGSLTITSTGNWVLQVRIKRTGTTTAYATAWMQTATTATAIAVVNTSVTGITFTNAVPFKLTATSGNGSSDITEMDGTGKFD
jgi:hypothetical protein